LKFDDLLKYSEALNADYLATGHYARIEKLKEDHPYWMPHSNGGALEHRTHTVLRYRLKKAVDASKDQSYFLYMLTQNQLSKLLFPLGRFEKKNVRELAGIFGLPTAEKDESMDVCFLEGRNYQDFLIERVPAEKLKVGFIKTTDGKVLGEHAGLPFYTIGQRDQLGISAGHRLYVVQKDTHTNTLIVGTDKENRSEGCAVKNITWCEGRPPLDPWGASV